MSFRLRVGAAVLMIGLAVAAPWGLPAGALAAAPVPPCAGEVPQDFAPLGAPPSVGLWKADALPAEWQPAACSRIERRDGAVLVAVAGRFASPLDGRQLLAKLGSVSDHTSITYWSATDGHWRPLLEAAYALTGPDRDLARGDFTLGELARGKTVYLVYDDAEPVGPVVNAVEIVAADASGFTVTSRNLTSARLMGLPIAAPGDIASHLSIEREAPGVYRYFALASTALSVPLLREASHIHRAVAVYHYIAGIEGDQRSRTVAR